jgi:cytochrome c-type biogenesis protein CcmH/NrfG
MGKGPVILIIIFLGLGVAIWLAPHSPKNVLEDEVETSGVLYETPDEKVDAAVAIIRDAQGAPMQGIQMLREVIDEHPDFLRAHYFLGEFSVMSGQYDKAIERFQKVLEIDPAHLGGIRYLAIAYTENDQPQEALTILETFMVANPEHPAMADLRELKDFIAAQASSAATE